MTTQAPCSSVWIPSEAGPVTHNDCIIGSKPGVSGAWCFTHAVRIVRDGLTWKGSS